MARTKQTARKSAPPNPRKHLAKKAARKEKPGQALRLEAKWEETDDNGATTQKWCPLKLYKGVFATVQEVGHETTYSQSQFPLLVAFYEKESLPMWAMFAVIPGERPNDKPLPHLVHWDANGAATAVQIRKTVGEESSSAITFAWSSLQNWTDHDLPPVSLMPLQCPPAENYNLTQDWVVDDPSDPVEYTGGTVEKAEYNSALHAGLLKKVHGRPTFFGVGYSGEGAEGIWWQVLLADLNGSVSYHEKDTLHMTGDCNYVSSICTNDWCGAAGGRKPVAVFEVEDEPDAGGGPSGVAGQGEVRIPSGATAQVIVGGERDTIVSGPREGEGDTSDESDDGSKKRKGGTIAPPAPKIATRSPGMALLMPASPGSSEEHPASVPEFEKGMSHSSPGGPSSTDELRAQPTGAEDEAQGGPSSTDEIRAQPTGAEDVMQPSITPFPPVPDSDATTKSPK